MRVARRVFRRATRVLAPRLGCARVQAGREPRPGSGDREAAVHGQDRPGHQAGPGQVGDRARHVRGHRHPPGGHAARHRGELRLPLVAGQEVPPGASTTPGETAFTRTGASSAPETVADIVFGTIWYRILATMRPFDAALEDDLLDLLAPGW